MSAGHEERNEAAPPCPMASMCKGMADKSRPGFLLMIPGIVLVLAGVLILVEPRILVWLMAGTSIVLGLVALVLANRIRRLAAQEE